MKEYYTSFITSSICMIPPILMENLPEIFIYPFLMFGVASIIFFFRGVYLWMPYPIMGGARTKFEEACPDSIGLCRQERVTLYKQGVSGRCS